MVKIRIKPKIVVGTIETTTNERERGRERGRERQEECCDEIRSLRCEMDTMNAAMNEMKAAMDEMKAAMNEMRLRGSCDDDRRCHRSNHDHEKSGSDFGEWASGLEVTRQDLEAMFESSDLVDWASKFIVADLKQRSGHPYPLCAIKGSKNELLMYCGGAWKKIADQEFASTIVNKVFKKLLAVFTAWKNENYNRILTSEHYSTLYHSNYARILSFNENASKLKTKLFHAL
jgi:hypothetical protein